MDYVEKLEYLRSIYNDSTITDNCWVIIISGGRLKKVAGFLIDSNINFQFDTMRYNHIVFGKEELKKI